jgi:pyruvate dehydrogenase E1 component alpha subunit
MKTKSELIAFETQIAEAFERGKLPYLLHLSGGNEDELCQIFQSIQPEDWVFGTHRSHYHYLLKGGTEERLETLIREGRSMFIFDAKLRFFTSSIVAGCCAIAAGVAKSIRMRGGAEWVYCFIGDAGTDEGHFYEAARYVDGHRLPCTFIVEDNNRSVETTNLERWGRHSSGVLMPACVIQYQYTPTYPHAGTGCKQRVVFQNPEPPAIW